MASRMFLLCLLVSLLSVSYIESKGHGGHGGSHSSHSGGHSYGHSSGHSYGHSSGHSYGHSGSSSSHTYPSSSSGLSGTGSHGYGSSSSGSHTYPGGAGLSGAHSFGYNHRYNSRPHTSNSYSGHYGSHSSTSNEYHNAPSYYKAPEYVYVNEYRTSNSRYGDLLTGLSLYNYGRSQSHYRDHYYYDDYYRRRYPSSTSYNQENPYSQDDKPQDVANCVLKVKEYEREEVLKIPCEIVSTFTEGSNKMAPSRQTQVNKTVCTSTFITVPAATVRPEYRTTEKPKTYNSEEIMTDILHIDLDEINKYKNMMETYNNRDDSYHQVIPRMNFTIPNFDFNMPKFNLHSESLTLESGMWPTNSTVDSLTGSVTTTVTVFNATTQNVTVCTTNYTFVDPLTEHGPRVDPKYMQCVVEIQTKDAFLSNIIDCNVLAEYAKLPEPKKETILPERQKLKSWLDRPPWWLSLFIAV